MDLAATARRRVYLMQGVITAPPGVSMRRATEADFDGIKQLTASSIALKGADFLVANYHEYIHEPERYLYVALKDDRVIACYMNYVVDGGRTAEAGAARRHPDFKGQTVFKALVQYSLIDTLSERPSVEKIRGGSPHVAYYDDVVLKRPHYTAISRMRYTSLAKAVPCRDVASALTPDLIASLAKHGVHLDDVRPAAKGDLQAIFGDSKLSQRVFPGNVISAGLDFFEPSTENLQALFYYRRKYTISKDSLSVCVAEFWQSPVGFVFYVVLHGEATASVAMAHFMSLVKHAISNCSPDKPLNIIYIITDAIQRESFVTLSKLLPFQTDDKAMYTDYVIVEGHIPKIPSSL